MTPVSHMTLRAFLHWLITDWSFLPMTPSAEFLSRLPSLLHHDEKNKTKIKQTTNTNVHDTQMLSVDTFLHVCVCESVQTPAHTRYVAADKHTHTHSHVSVHRPRPSLPNPSPVSQYTASVLFAVRLWFCWGGWSCPLSVRSEWDRRMERRSEEEEEEMKMPEGPQLASAMVSMTCSSLLLSLCLLACSSRSSADRICRRRGQKVSRGHGDAAGAFGASGSGGFEPNTLFTSSLYLTM